MPNITIAQKNTPKGKEPITIRSEDRRNHTYLIGQTGTGKSTLLANMIVQDIWNGAGVCLVDPHGDLAEDILNHIPKHRTQDVAYFDPTDRGHPPGLNLLEIKPDQEKDLIVSSTVSIFRHLFKSWGNTQTEFLAHNCISALLDSPDTTLVDVYRMLVDRPFRRRIAENIQDPIVRLYWQSFEHNAKKFTAEIISPLQNKVGQLIISSYLRNIVGQPKSTIDLDHILNHQGILIVNLSKGKIGEERANLLGSVIINKLFLSSLERQQIPERERRDFYLYVDEFQNFSTDSFSSILSEARKYRLNLILAHQYLDQVSEDIRKSVFGNVGTWIVFRVGATDAQLLEKEFQPYIKPEELVRKRNYSVIYKLLAPSIPLSTSTLPFTVPEGEKADRDTIVRVSQERFTTDRNYVEQKINERLKSTQ